METDILLESRKVFPRCGVWIQFKMALLNRNLKGRDVDQLPLIEEPEKVVVDLEEDDEEEKEEVFNHHGITLWVSDAVIMVTEHVQIFALILAMAMRWGFPSSLIKSLYFVFLFNVDIWEFMKVYNQAYTQTTKNYLPSDSIGIDYTYYLIAWSCFVVLVCAGFLITYCVFLYKKPIYLLLHVARMKRIFCIAAQLLCLPVGIAFARVFHCRPDLSNVQIWNVQNDVKCWDATIHWGFFGAAIFVSFLMFIAYPINLIRKTRGQVICFDRYKHESYLQLKEAEYMQGLDILWAVGQFHLFSSFRRLWIYYRPTMFILKFCLLYYFAVFLSFGENTTWIQKLTLNVPIAACFFAFLFGTLSSGLTRPPVSVFRSFLAWFLWKFFSEIINIIFNPSLGLLLPKFALVVLAFGVFSIREVGGAMGALLSLLILIMLRSLPFRVQSFNFMMIFSLLVNVGNAYIGAIVDEYNSNSFSSVLAVDPYPHLLLFWLNLTWVIVTILWIAYLLCRHFDKRHPLWPKLSTDGNSDMSEETKKYMRAVLRGRHILEKALSSPPIFSPVHELERHIQIINAYCREAEYIEDPTFDSLWDLLDELIEAHTRLAPHSLFSQSTKRTVRQTAKEFEKMMPQMRKRLDQREYDFILLSPMKRRMLLKMYTLGLFVNGRLDKEKREIAKKVHQSLQQSEVAKETFYASSTPATDFDSVSDIKDTYPYMYGSMGSIKSRPQSTGSYSSRPDSVERLLNEVDSLEEGRMRPGMNMPTGRPMALIEETDDGDLHSGW